MWLFSTLVCHEKNSPSTRSNADQLELRPGQSIELLQELHILTRDARINQDSRRKLKQVYHLFQFIEPMLGQLRSQNTPWAVADHGAGKSYLGFILYDLFVRHGQDGHIFGIETRSELVQRSQELAQRFGFERMSFLNLSVAQSMHEHSLPNTMGMVTALHACDTATDDAIEFALQKQAQFIVLIPCCQAELAGLLRHNKAQMLSKTPLAELWRHPLHTRELGSQITNVLRCLYLEASGYQVTVTELVGWEHSMKNELILAQYTGHKKRSAAKRMQQILESLGQPEHLHRRFHRVEELVSQEWGTDNSAINELSA